jgi:hypothetical protein
VTGGLAGVQAPTPDNAEQPTAASMLRLLTGRASRPLLGEAEGERQGSLTTEGYGE